MRVRCKAIADFRGNCLGTLELEPRPEGLVIAYLGVGSYQDGYAPGPLTRGTQLCAPWAQVYATRLGEENLLISIDQRLTPLNRFLLSHFTRGDVAPPAELRRRRRIVAVGAGAALILTLLGAALFLPAAIPHAGALTVLGIAGSAALLILLLGVSADQSLTLAQPSSRVLVSELSSELSRYLPHHVPSEPAVSVQRPFEPRELSALLPKSVVGVAITLTATGLAALVGSAGIRPTAYPSNMASGYAVADPALSALASSDPARAQLPLLRGGPDGLPASGHETPAAGLALGEPCTCLHHDSLLWRQPLPRLSLIVTERNDREHVDHPHIDLEVAAVNDGNRSLERVNATVVFYEAPEGKAPNERQKTVERPLYFAGRIEPGRSVKWLVEGRGSSFEIVTPDLGTLEPDGSNAAPADAFATLARNQRRALRLHSSIMLGFLGDARAKGVALDLAEDRLEDEAPYLERVLESTRSVRACQLEVEAATRTTYRVRSCLHNTAREDRSGLSLRLRALDAALDRRTPREPLALADERWPLSVSLPAQAGRSIELSADLALPPGVEPRAFELTILRKDSSE